MKKNSLLLLVAIIATSCAVGTYYPYAQNHFGAQSSVVLNNANFRVVRDVEVIVDVNNTNLNRASVANSAYGELLRKAQLTGSQVLINVVIEEVRRESGGFFRLLFGIPKRVQHVAARATIIEFLDENGNPTVSEAYRPKNQQQIKISSSNSTTTSNSGNRENIEQIENSFSSIINKMVKLGWVQSILYKNYYAIANMLKKQNSENAKDHLHKVNVVINKIINNELSKEKIEKELVTATQSGNSTLDVFLAYY